MGALFGALLGGPFGDGLPAILLAASPTPGWQRVLTQRPKWALHPKILVQGLLRPSRALENPDKSGFRALGVSFIVNLSKSSSWIRDKKARPRPS